MEPTGTNAALWSRFVGPTGTKGGISPGWFHETGPMLFLYIHHLVKFDEHIAQIDAVRCPDAARRPPPPMPSSSPARVVAVTVAAVAGHSPAPARRGRR